MYLKKIVGVRFSLYCLFSVFVNLVNVIELNLYWLNFIFGLIFLGLILSNWEIVSFKVFWMWLNKLFWFIFVLDFIGICIVFIGILLEDGFWVSFFFIMFLIFFMMMMWFLLNVKFLYSVWMLVLVCIGVIFVFFNVMFLIFLFVCMLFFF